MKPLVWPSRIRLPRPRTPLPAYMTLPSAAASTGEPVAPSMSMPLVLLLKPWMILPVAGHAQETRAASLARAPDVVAASSGAALSVPPLGALVLGAGAVVLGAGTGTGVATTAGPLDDGAGWLP